MTETARILGNLTVMQSEKIESLKAEIETLREAAEAAYNDWAVGEPMDRGMKELGKALGYEIDVP